ncbi:sugar ABC transporter ATP-binding protein [Rhizobiaceae bacterium]|nr:sugar ABC transporter ATP-binding protein [Rhizobiaceae bacterium]
MGRSLNGDPIISVEGVDRHFGPVQVLHGIDFSLRPGEVHALIGENGAGKSTTMKIMAGYLAATGGRIVLDGAHVTFSDPKAAEAAGIVMIHQEFNLAEHLSVEENVFLGREIKRGFFLDKAAMRRETEELLNRLHCTVRPDTRIDRLSNPDKQMVEIAKALASNARVLIMDEPTAVLTTRETKVLLHQVERLRAAGAAILFTSHKLNEVKAISDRVTVMRDGEVVHCGPTDELSEDEMATAMVGREMSKLYPVRTHAPGRVALAVDGLDVPGFASDISFSLRRGEILGFAGLIGSGRTETMEGLVGLRAATGTIAMDGQPVTIREPKDALAARIVYLTEDRKGRGLLLGKGMRENLTLQSLADFARPFIDRAGEEAALTKAIAEFDIRAPHRDVAVGNLSGGNQQKLLIAKTMLANPEIVIIDEPTRGIDIGTKQQIYAFLAALAADGKAIIVVSSEMQELIGLADRVLVMREGRIAGEITGSNLNERSIVRLAMGVASEGMAA